MSKPAENFNSDELVPPSFVTEKFIRDLAVSSEGGDDALQLTSYEVKPGSSAGDHYASIMFKIIVSYQSKGKTVSGRRFILKRCPRRVARRRTSWRTCQFSPTKSACIRKLYRRWRRFSADSESDLGGQSKI